MTDAASTAALRDAPPARGVASELLLSVTDLCVDATSEGRRLRLVQDVAFEVRRGETVGLMGESGSGKTVTAMSIAGLLPAALRVSGGSIVFGGRQLTRAGDADMRHIRGGEIGMIFQDPQNSLNPSFTVGNQLIEALRAHRRMSLRQAREEAIQLLERVGVPRARHRLDDYPHQFSGGMAQRAMIAIAICCRPKLLIADEPTTALDVTVQAQILELLQALQAETAMSVLLISHDLSVIAEMTDHVAIMYAGQVVERGRTSRVFHKPFHPYTEALLSAHPRSSGRGETLRTIPGTVPNANDMPSGCRFHPRCSYAQDRCFAEAPGFETPSGSAASGARCLLLHELTLKGVQQHDLAARPRERLDDRPLLLQAHGLSKEFKLKRVAFRRRLASILAVDGVDFEIREGETFGLVGESGAGKTTVGRLVLGLTEPTSGTVRFGDVELTGRNGHGFKLLRREIQAVSQNPYASLDPTMTVGECVAEPIDVHRRWPRREREARVAELLTQVGLDASYAGRYPYELSGGQRQRVAIARALALNPRLIVCDEPVSALDVSTQAQVINLLKELQQRLGLAYLFVGHDLSVVHHISDRIAVMYMGRVVETGWS
ncbi:MAG: ABC transporter ATP-binding protein, partial [Chloroflexota bacterium]|nr:ABC transporter ATP-binding protein [Chloroflexota bacterium]